MNILILHGVGGYAGVHWQQWLHDQLEARGHHVMMPTLPAADHPDRAQWLETTTDCLKEFSGDGLCIIGHSLGVATALDYLEQECHNCKALFCVSGFAEDYGAELNSYFMQNKRIDTQSVVEHSHSVHVMYGDNDPYVSQEALQQLAAKLHVSPIIIHKGGHLNTEAGYDTFPKLLELIYEI